METVHIWLFLISCDRCAGKLWWPGVSSCSSALCGRGWALSVAAGHRSRAGLCVLSRAVCPEQGWLWVSSAPGMSTQRFITVGTARLWQGHTALGWHLTHLLPAWDRGGWMCSCPQLCPAGFVCRAQDRWMVTHKTAQSSPQSMMSFWYFIFRVKYYNGAISSLQAKN